MSEECIGCNDITKQFIYRNEETGFSLNASFDMKPEEIKVNIWGYELCNGAEWKDFLDVVNILGKDKADLEAKLAECENRIQAYEEIVEQKDEEISFANRDKTCIVKQLNDPKAYVSLEDYKELEQQLAQYEKFMKDNEWNSIEEMQETLNKCEKKYFDIQKQFTEKEKQYQDAVSNCVKLANTRAILKLHKVQDRINDIKSKYNCDIEYQLRVNNELTHLWEYINKLIEEMSNGT